MKREADRILEAMRSAAPRLQNGTYTVSHPDRAHFTVEVRTALKGGLAGKRIIALLVGSDNTADYMGVAFWDDDAEGKGKANVWRKHRGDGSRGVVDGYAWSEAFSIVERKLTMMLDLALRGDEGFWHAEGYELLRAGACVRCNRKLTTPESIELGIGPVCARKGN
jgi:hypothetical protein